MAFSAAVFGAAAVTAAGAILKFEADNVLNDGPSALLEPNPEGAVASVAQAIARQSCRRYADDPSGLDEDFSVNMETVCRPYLDNIGYGSGPKLLKPFEGGQCPKLYQVQGSVTTESFTNCSTGFTGGPLAAEFFSTEFSVLGPISGFTSRRVQPATCGGFDGFIVEAITPGGPQVVYQRQGTGQVRRQVSFSISAINPVDGIDDCGNPPPELIDPVPPPTPGPDTEPYNPNPDIDIDITVNLNPDSLIEVNLGLGPVIIAPFGGGGGEPGEPGVDPDTSAPAPEPGPENPGGNGGFGGDDEFGPPPAGRRWVGCCIRIVNTPSNASSIPGSEPEDVYPSVVGNIRLVCNAAGNRLTDTPVRIMAKNVCVWEPVQKLNPTGVNVDLLPGYGYTFRPFSVPSGD